MDINFDNPIWGDLFPCMRKSTADFYEHIDLTELQNRIRKFRRLNIRFLDDNELFTEINNVLSIGNQFIYPTCTRIFAKGTEFYRVRSLSGSEIPFSELTTVSDMWEPPASVVSRPGRLNKVGESVLYATQGQPYVAVQETRILLNQYYALMSYVAIDDVKINYIGWEYTQDELQMSDKAYFAFCLINDFLHDEYSRDVGQGTEFLYRVSESIAKSYFDLPEEMQDAWAYNSVFDKNAINVCFRPQIAHNKMILKGAMICKNTDQNQIQVFCVALPNTDGSISYYELGSAQQMEAFPEIVYKPDGK